MPPVRAVEIGRAYLSLDYGRNTEIRNITLLHAMFDSTALEGIIKKFRYETENIPTITQ